ncbi:MAG: hypothetical protein L0287_34335 [Anaerolineae bacterium]|nr:hypothetical protein [Anaerolineae bacterium]
MSETMDLEQVLGVQTPSTGQLSDLESMVGRACSLMEQLNSIEELAKGVKAELHQLTTRSIPDAMAESGTLEFKTVAGVKVTVKDFINGSLPKEPDARMAALSWLSRNGAADLIKEYVALEFPRGQHDFAEQVKSQLEKVGATYNSKEDVHAQTLAAYARERLRAGESLPMDLLGLYAGRKANIQLP